MGVVGESSRLVAKPLTISTTDRDTPPSAGVIARQEMRVVSIEMTSGNEHDRH
jgi:hypothetical protein